MISNDNIDIGLGYRSGLYYNLDYSKNDIRLKLLPVR